MNGKIFGDLELICGLIRFDCFLNILRSRFGSHFPQDHRILGLKKGIDELLRQGLVGGDSRFAPDPLGHFGRYRTIGRGLDSEDRARRADYVRQFVRHLWLAYVRGKQERRLLNFRRDFDEI